jgi:hypothetical protein
VYRACPLNNCVPSSAALSGSRFSARYVAKSRSQGARHEVSKRSPSRRSTEQHAIVSPSRDLEVSFHRRLVALLCRRLLVMLLTPCGER